MRILLTNDDGIHAEGLAVLERIAQQIGDEVWVVAPESDQSGLAHSLTLSDPLRIRKIDEHHYAVRGTPTDCVIMAVRHIMKQPPDIILSGINVGANLADDVTYSGTVAGAMEGTMLGIRSFALSQVYQLEGDKRLLPWHTAEALAPDLLRRLIAMPYQPGILLNINFPACEVDDVTGEAVTEQGRLAHNIHVEQRHDGRGLPYFWLFFSRRDAEISPLSDIAAIRDNKISISPLQLDLTAHETIASLRKALGDE